MTPTDWKTGSRVIQQRVLDIPRHGTIMELEHGVARIAWDEDPKHPVTIFVRDFPQHHIADPLG